MNTKGKTNKQYGSLYEAMFIVEALKRNLHVCDPRGDYLPYDFVVDNGKRLLKIQVKGTKTASESGFKVTTAKGNSTGKKTPHDKGAYDFLVAVVLTDGNTHWYIIPESEVRNQMAVKFYINPTSTGKFEKYKHGWDLIC